MRFAISLDIHTMDMITTAPPGQIAQGGGGGERGNWKLREISIFSFKTRLRLCKLHREEQEERDGA